MKVKKNIFFCFVFQLDTFDTEYIIKPRSRTMIETFPSTLTNANSYLSTSIDNSNNHENGYDDDDYDSLEYQFSSYGFEAFKLFKEFIQKLNNIHHLQYILTNWLIGNQLIIKYTNRIDNKDFIRAFASVFRVKEKMFYFKKKKKILFLSLFIVIFT